MIYEATNSNTGTLKFYGQVSEWWNNGDDFTRTFSEMEKKFKNIDIRLHSYGGSVFEGNVIFNAIKRSKANVTVYIDGVAASMASIIMLAADKIVAADNAFIMIHSPSAGINGPAEDHENAARLLRSLEKNFAKAYSQKTGQSEEDAHKWMDTHDHWLNAEEALAEGLINAIGDAVISNLQDLGKPDNEGETEFKQLFGKYAALLKDNGSKNLNNKPANAKASADKSSKMKKDLIKKFSLGLADDATDADVLIALSDKFGGVEAALTKLQNEQKAQRTNQINALIDTAEASRTTPFDEKVKEQLVAIGEKAGVEALSAALKLSPAETKKATSSAPQIVSMLSGKKTTDADPHADWDWDKFQEEDPDALDELKAKQPDKFKALYKAKYKVEPELK